MATIDVDGMTCAVCVSRVESVISEVDGISNVAVNLAKGSANFSGTADVDNVIAAVNNSGYKASMPINYFQKWKFEKEKLNREIKISTISLVYSLLAMYYIMAAENDQTIFGLFSMCIVLSLNWKVLQKGLNSIILIKIFRS